MLQVYMSLVIEINIMHIYLKVPSKVIEGMGYCMVLNRGADDVFYSVRMDCSGQDRIVSFSAARSEKDLAWSTVQELSHFLPGRFYGSPHDTAVRMSRGWIAEMFEHEGTHCLKYFGIQRCCCRVV